MHRFRPRAGASRAPRRRFRYGTYRTGARSRQAGPTRLSKRPTTAVARPCGSAVSFDTDCRRRADVAPVASRPRDQRNLDRHLPTGGLTEQCCCGTSTSRRTNHCCASGNESHHCSARRQRPTCQRLSRRGIAEQ